MGVRLGLVLSFFLAFSSVAGRFVIPLKFVHEHGQRQVGGGGPASGLQGIPLQCASQCRPVFTITQTCRAGDTACACTAQVANEYQACLDCLSTFIDTDPTLGSSIQSAANVLNTGCARAGIAIPLVTIPAAAAAPTPTPPTPQTPGLPTQAPTVTALSPTNSDSTILSTPTDTIVVNPTNDPVNPATTSQAPVVASITSSAVGSSQTASAVDSNDPGAPILAPPAVAASGTSAANKDMSHLSAGLLALFVFLSSLVWI